MKIIVPLRTETLEELKVFLSKVCPKANVIEFWIDTLYKDFEGDPRKSLEAHNLFGMIQAKYNIQYTAVCKTPAEKGSFQGSPKERMHILKQFLQIGGNFLDLDIKP